VCVCVCVQKVWGGLRRIFIVIFLVVVLVCSCCYYNYTSGDPHKGHAYFWDSSPVSLTGCGVRVRPHTSHKYI